MSENDFIKERSSLSSSETTRSIASSSENDNFLISDINDEVLRNTIHSRLNNIDVELDPPLIILFDDLGEPVRAIPNIPVEIERPFVLIEPLTQTSFIQSMANYVRFSIGLHHLPDHKCFVECSLPEHDDAIALLAKLEQDPWIVELKRIAPQALPIASVLGVLPRTSRCYYTVKPLVVGVYLWKSHD
jgi:hypothetical protein